LNRSLSFLYENGFYTFGTHLVGSALGGVRNAFLSRMFGVRKIRIGSGAYLRGLGHIEMGEDFSAEGGLWLEAVTRYNEQVFLPRIVIGRQVRVSRFGHIAATHFVEIGDNVLMGSNVLITDHNHGYYSGQHTPPDVAPALRPLDDSRQVRIGDNVWLGDGAIIMPGASIGAGSIIGAHSIVIGSIPSFSIAVGTPATVRKTFDFDSREWISVLPPGSVRQSRL
jgi:lipopolysaccharide O-acetyltransferase